MKISEMSLEELQDYAVSLEETNATLTQEKSALNTQITDLTALNQQLQRRNNDLFMKVEQGVKTPPTPSPEQPKTESCEDFAKSLILGGKL